jgi:hypothetical protein
MTLIAGTMLQSSKYVIQACLHQSDFGVTYRATHTLLAQPVILQTLNPVVQQRPDFAELKQQFMEGVRSLSQQETAPETARVLDCFEEEEMPFVVLRSIEGQALPKLSEWLKLPPEPLVSVRADAVPEVLPVVSAPEIAVAAAPTQTSQATVAVAPKAPTPKVLPLLPNLPAQGDRPDLTEAPKRKLPIALLITALAGLGLGAGGGLAVRYQPTPQKSADTPRSTSNFSSNLFSHEQPFPPQSDWPVQEDPKLFPSAPKLEEPVYRSVPAPNYYTAPAPVQPLYTNPVPQPAAPSPYDSTSDSKSIPDSPSDPAPSLSPIPKPDVTLNAPRPAPRRDAAIDTPPIPDATIRQAAPVPAPELSPLVPLAPDPIGAPPETSAPPAQAPKGLGTRPLVSQ